MALRTSLPQSPVIKADETRSLSHTHTSFRTMELVLLVVALGIAGLNLRHLYNGMNGIGRGLILVVFMLFRSGSPGGALCVSASFQTMASTCRFVLQWSSH